MIINDLDIIVIDKLIKERQKQLIEERPFLQLEVEEFKEEPVKEKKEPKRVIIIDLWLLYY